MRVDEIGWFAASFYPAGFRERYLTAIGQYEVPYDRKIKHLSRGQRAKVALALALAHDPELLILDEPTSGLDPLVRREFLESMLDRVATGQTVLLSSHQISEVERAADWVAILHEGKFRLVDTLDNLRSSILELTVTLHDSLSAIPSIASPAEVLREEQLGRQRRFTVRGWTARHQAEFEQWLGVASVATRNATLEEIFAACVRGSWACPGSLPSALGRFWSVRKRNSERSSGFRPCRWPPPRSSP